MNAPCERLGFKRHAEAGARIRARNFLRAQPLTNIA
jgi:hypothetical protein